MKVTLEEREEDQENPTRHEATVRVKKELQPTRETIETKEDVLQKGLTGVLQQLESQRQLTESKTEELYEMERIVTELGEEVKKLTVKCLDIQRIKEEKEMQLQHEVRICECLQTELNEKDKLITELHKVQSRKNSTFETMNQQQTQQSKGQMPLDLAVHADRVHVVEQEMQATAKPKTLTSKTTDSCFARFQVGDGDNYVTEDKLVCGEFLEYNYAYV